MKPCICISFLLTNISLSGQGLTFGDSSVMESIKQKTSWIYEHKDATHFFLTQSQLLSEKTRGITITAYANDGVINRLIAIATTKRGQLASEWYFDKQELIYVYSTFEYFDEVKNKGSWQNFKGLFGWESRYYFADGVLKFSKHKGEQNLDKRRKGASLLTNARAVLAFVEQKLSEK